MIQKPEQFTSIHAETFQALDVVEAYQHRPPYSNEAFSILLNLLNGSTGHVLDIGCGRGEIARNLVSSVERVDAVDASQAMIEKGKILPNGNHPRLCWHHGYLENIPLHPPYTLMTSGESLPWMEENIVLPRLRQMLAPGGFLATIHNILFPNPWLSLSRLLPDPWPSVYELVSSYSVNSPQRYDMIAALEQNSLFSKKGEQVTTPIVFAQSIEAYIESFHSRIGFSRADMRTTRALAFDRELREILLKTYSNGILLFSLSTKIIWGLPGNG